MDKDTYIARSFVGNDIIGDLEADLGGAIQYMLAESRTMTLEVDGILRGLLASRTVNNGLRTAVEQAAKALDSASAALTQAQARAFDIYGVAAPEEGEGDDE